jgi:hypothetical protein
VRTGTFFFFGQLLAVSGLVMVAGCTSTPEKRPACPPAAVLGEAERLTRFSEGPGRDVLDIDYAVEVVDLRVGCKFTKDARSGPVVVVALAPVIVATLGPANRSREARFDYWVSVLDEQGAVLNKQLFPVTARFADNRSRVVLLNDDPPVTIDLPNPDQRGAAKYEILVGLQLLPEELEFNRRESRAGRR